MGRPHGDVDSGVAPRSSQRAGALRRPSLRADRAAPAPVQRERASLTPANHAAGAAPVLARAFARKLATPRVSK